jgi:hypothetical protein
LDGEISPNGADLLCRSLDTTRRFCHDTDVKVSSRLRQLDDPGRNEPHSVLNVVDHVGFLIVSTRFAKKALVQNRFRRRHPWIFLTGTAGGVQPFALDHDPHIMAMTGQGDIGLAGVGSACDVVHRSTSGTALDGIGRSRDRMDNLWNARMAAAPLLSKARPRIFDHTAIFESNCKANRSVDSLRISYDLPAGAVPNPVLVKRLTETDAVPSRNRQLR